jgi:hypothetical protein
MAEEVDLIREEARVSQVQVEVVVVGFLMEPMD